MQADQPTLLKLLLQQRHLQGHRSFCREYDRVARSVDKNLVGSWPSKAQFYRWLSGELTRLPYADHCMILEKMFHERSAAELFAPPDEALNETLKTEPPGAMKGSTGTHTLDISRIFLDRADFVHHVPPQTLFVQAKRIRSCGLSLNLVCQQYPDQKLGRLLEEGTSVECLFLDPAGESMRLRGIEEGHPAGHLSTLTRLNIDVMQRLRSKVSDEAGERLQLRTYEAPIRFNITLIDQRLCVMQVYMPYMRGVEAPTYILERRLANEGLFGVFEQTFTNLWNNGRTV
jgi:hypothetical protein